MNKLLCVVLAAAALAGSKGSAIPFPENYRQWTHVKSTLVGPQAPGFQNNGGYHHFYANEQAMEGYRTGTFPDGSILIDDGLESIEKDGVTSEGARRRVAVMVRDSRRFPESGGWGFEWYPGDTHAGSLDTSQKAACLICHQKAAPDLVFSQFRK